MRTSRLWPSNPNEFKILECKLQPIDPINCPNDFEVDFLPYCDGCMDTGALCAKFGIGYTPTIKNCKYDVFVCRRGTKIYF